MTADLRAQAEAAIRDQRMVVFQASLLLAVLDEADNAVAAYRAELAEKVRALPEYCHDSEGLWHGNEPCTAIDSDRVLALIEGGES